MLRAALIGCGRIGWKMADDPLMAGDVFTHAEAYARSPATTLVATCDADPARARACAVRWGVPAAFGDAAAMLAATAPEIVSVCTPDAAHAPTVRALVEADAGIRAILCEKPLALTLDDAEALAALAADRGVLLSVVYMRRFAANARALAARLAAGEFGAVCAVSGWYTGGVLHNGTHWFDLLRMFAGEVSWVEALSAFDAPDTTDPTLDVTLGLASGALATLRAVDRRRFTIFEMEIMTEHARIAIADSGHRITIHRATPSPRYSGYVELAAMGDEVPGGRRDLMLGAVDNLAGALLSSRAPIATAVGAVAALRIAATALKAAAAGRRHSIPEPVHADATAPR